MTELEIKSFNKPDEVRMFEGKGHADVLQIGDKTVVKSTFEKGWRWSNNVKPIAGTDSCQTAHFGYAIQGKLRVYMNDGSEYDLGPGDLAEIPPGHDAEVLGDTECVFLDFGDVANYAKKK